jgi:hypothetical protein
MTLKAEIALATVLLTGILGLVQGHASEQDVLSKSQVHSLMQTAHTPQEYEELASYFRARQQAYEHKAQGEAVEMRNRTRPKFIEISRGRYEDFKERAAKAGSQAMHYEQLASKPQ